MKILVLLTGVLISQVSFSQKIEATTFDKKDSVYTLQTSTETIGSRIVGQSNDIKIIRFSASYQKGVGSRWRSDTAFEAVVYFFFRPDAVAAITGGMSSVKVVFDDREVVEHKDEGSKRLVGSNQTAAVFFTVLETDKLFTTSMRSVKVSVSSGEEVEFIIDNKKKEMVKNALQLLYKESRNLQ